MAAITKEQAIEFLSNLDPMQLRVLVREVEAKWGLQPVGGLVMGVWMPAAPIPVYGVAPVFVTEFPGTNPPGPCLAGPAYGVPGTWGEEQYEFTVTLVKLTGNRLDAFKLVRAITGVGLAESKAFVESLPKVLKRDVSKADAEDIRKMFQGIGVIRLD